MTEKEFTRNVKVLLYGIYDDVIKKATELFHSGAIDPANYKYDDFLLTKAILYVALGNTRENIRPLSKETLKLVKNLEHFREEKLIE